MRAPARGCASLLRFSTVFKNNNIIIYYRRKRVAADGHRDGTTPDSDLAGQSKDDIIFAVQSARLFNNHYIIIIFNSTRSMRRKLERNRRH
jgi:hypothetical protein